MLARRAVEGKLSMFTVAFVGNVGSVYNPVSALLYLRRDWLL
jgi:hypothetical protein